MADLHTQQVSEYTRIKTIHEIGLEIYKELKFDKENLNEGISYQILLYPIQLSQYFKEAEFILDDLLFMLSKHNCLYYNWKKGLYSLVQDYQPFEKVL
jgi:hypothetical protein